MAKEIGGVYGKIPSIHPNWGMAGSVSKAKWAKKEEPYLTREEFVRLMEKDFSAVYLQETGESLRVDEQGIVVFQSSLFPFNRDIVISPKLKEHCSYSVKEMDKVLKMPYAFESRTYWLEKGKISLILDPVAVLDDKAAEKVVNFLQEKYKWQNVNNKGVFNIACGSHKRPCRVYEIAGENLVLLNLTNGVINIVPSTLELEPIDVSKEFHCGYIRFRKETRGYVKL